MNLSNAKYLRAIIVALVLSHANPLHSQDFYLNDGQLKIIRGKIQGTYKAGELSLKELGETNICSGFHLKETVYVIFTDKEQFLLDINYENDILSIIKTSNKFSCRAIGLSYDDMSFSVNFKNNSVNASYKNTGYEERTINMSGYPLKDGSNKSTKNNILYSDFSQSLFINVPNSTMTLVIDLRKGRFETLTMDRLSGVEDYKNTHWFKSNDNLIAVIESMSGQFTIYNFGKQLPEKVGGTKRNGTTVFPDQTFKMQGKIGARLKNLPLYFKNNAPVYIR